MIPDCVKRGRCGEERCPDDSLWLGPRPCVHVRVGLSGMDHVGGMTLLWSSEEQTKDHA